MCCVRTHTGAHTSPPSPNTLCSPYPGELREQSDIRMAEPAGSRQRGERGCRRAILQKTFINHELTVKSSKLPLWP